MRSIVLLAIAIICGRPYLVHSQELMVSKPAVISEIESAVADAYASVNAVVLVQLPLGKKEVQLLHTNRALCLEGFRRIQGNIAEVRIHGQLLENLLLLIAVRNLDGYLDGLSMSLANPISYSDPDAIRRSVIWAGEILQVRRRLNASQRELESSLIDAVTDADLALQRCSAKP